MSVVGTRTVILAEAYYEDLELWYPLLRLRGEGVVVQVVGTGAAATYKGKAGYPVDVDITADQVSAADIDAVVIPGGYAPDRLRRYPAVLRLVREAFEQGKIVAAICHAGWVLISAGIVKDRRLTSFSAIKDDLVNAGATWVDEEVVQDGNLITSRQPSDLPAFTDAILTALGGIEFSGLAKLTEATSALDALRMAIQAEEAAYRFYTMAVQRTNDPEAKNIFHTLAQEEARHRSVVQDEYNRLTADPDWDRYGIWRDVL